jgi:hypothetical protein
MYVYITTKIGYNRLQKYGSKTKLKLSEKYNRDSKES